MRRTSEDQRSQKRGFLFRRTMYYANTEQGKIPAQHGVIGSCPNCGGVVIPKCGEINAHHWAHKSLNECDVWADGETDWHLNWKSFFPPEMVEVSLEKNGEKHRADVLLPSGWVLEFQHSPISAEEIQVREDFWGKIIWIIDCKYTDPLQFDWKRLEGEEDTPDWMPPKTTFEITHHATKKDPFDVFIWRHAKRSYQSAKWICIDRGPAIFLVKKIYWQHSPPTGWGHYHNKTYFLESVLGITIPEGRGTDGLRTGDIFGARNRVGGLSVP